MPGSDIVPTIVPLPDLAATEALARHVASVARAGDCILLEGPLGAGKTAFARAFLRAAAKDPAMDVPSPSFTLVQTYDTTIGPVFHYDLWRIEGSNSLSELDWEDALDAIVLVEWPERLGSLRPEGALTISLRLCEGEVREATITGWGERLSAGISVGVNAEVPRPDLDIPDLAGLDPGISARSGVWGDPRIKPNDEKSKHFNQPGTPPVRVGATPVYGPISGCGGGPVANHCQDEGQDAERSPPGKAPGRHNKTSLDTNEPEE